MPVETRAHCEIRQRADKFLPAGRSASRTCVAVDADSEIVLRREEYTLRGNGCIAPRQSRETAAGVVRLFCAQAVRTRPGLDNRSSFS